MISMLVLTPGHKAYQPRGGALDLFYCKNDEILIEGPAGTGKSRGVLEKLLLCAMKYPGIRILMMRKTRASMTESVLVTFEEKVIPENLNHIKEGADRAHRKRYTLPNGSTFIVGGMDKADKIMSTEYDIIATFETHEFNEDEIEKLTTRLRNHVMPYQQLICDTNPAGPRHFLNLRCNRGQMTRILSRHEDNPSVTESYLNKLRALTGARRARLYEGKWADQEGLVYNYDPAVHLINRFEIPKEWTRYRVIDFGYTNPFVCQWWAQDPDKNIYRYREIYHTGRLVSDHAKVIKQFPEPIKWTVADHDAEDRATLHAAGIFTIAAKKAITTGIQSVEEKLKVKANGKPGIFFLRDSLIERDQSLVDEKKPCCTEEEFDSYAWPKGQDGKEKKEAPMKIDDHGMDCLKYICAELDDKSVLKPANYSRRK